MFPHLFQLLPSLHPEWRATRNWGKSKLRHLPPPLPTSPTSPTLLLSENPVSELVLRGLPACSLIIFTGVFLDGYIMMNIMVMAVS